MAKGTVGVSLGGSIEYRYQLKPTTKNCKNCKNYKQRSDSSTHQSKAGMCSKFHIIITDVTNARLCSSFTNKNSSTNRSHKKSSKKSTKK